MLRAKGRSTRWNGWTSSSSIRDGMFFMIKRPMAKRLKLFGITYFLVGKMKFKLSFSGSIGWVRLAVVPFTLVCLRLCLILSTIFKNNHENYPLGNIFSKHRTSKSTFRWHYRFAWDSSLWGNSIPMAVFCVQVCWANQGPWDGIVCF